MFESFYTTKMSPEKKKLEARFSKILGKRSKISKVLIISTTVLVVACAVSASFVLAAFDADEKSALKENEEVKTTIDEESDEKIETLLVASSEIFEDNKYHIPAEQEALVFSSPVVGEIKITTPYGEKTNPVTGASVYHNGVDIEAIEGDEIFSAIDGVVTKAEYDTKLGNFVVVENGKYSVLAAHLSSMDVKVGDDVKSGQLVGKAGKTGQATGVTLHFEFLVDGENVNPERVLNFDPTP